MTMPYRSPLIYYPKTLSDLLSLYKSMPDSILYAGGTSILEDKKTKYPVIPANVIFLSRIEELSSIRRSEGYIEIGACASLNKIIGIGEHVLKSALYKALSSIGTREVRNLATIGGNICSRYRGKNLIPLLAILDTRLEIRKQGGTRWISMKKFILPEEGIQSGEVLTRIRIPFNNFNHQLFVVTGNLKTNYKDALTFSSLASVQKEVITTIKFAAGYNYSSIFRTRDFEEILTGRKLPLYELTLDPAYNRLTTALKNSSEELSLLHQQQIEGLFLSFIHSLNDLI